MKKVLFPVLLFCMGLPSYVFAQDTGLTLNPVAGINARNATIPGLIARALQVLLGFAGVLGLIFFIYGGVMVLFSGGNPDKVKQGYKSLAWALIGLAVVFGSFLILNTVIRIIEPNL